MILNVQNSMLLKYNWLFVVVVKLELHIKLNIKLWLFFLLDHNSNLN